MWEKKSGTINRRPEVAADDVNNFTQKLNVGHLTNPCQHCAALKFPGESKGMCCNNGKVDLEPPPPLPHPLNTLFEGTSPESQNFLENIRKYNTVFQLTSLGCNEVVLPGWNPQFRIQGQVCHLIGSLLPNEANPPSFLQIYFMDGEDQISRRNNITHGLSPTILLDIQNTLLEHHKYVRELKCAYEFANAENMRQYSIVINEAQRPVGAHARTHNAPTLNEVAILMPNNPVGHRDIVLHLRSERLQRISELHRAYDCLQYPLLLPYGNDSWNLILKMTSQYKISQLQFYCFHFFSRQGNYLIQARKLYQQYIVDAYAKIECERLQFIRREQKRLRADSYQELRDTIINTDGNPQNVGQRIILPATYCGGPRYMFEKQQDAMCFVRTYGRPDLFITITTNPKWEEITLKLEAGQRPHDRPDLLVRVFRLKLKSALQAIKNGCFGHLTAWLYNIEFQKRGLPHAHMLLWLNRESKIQPDMIDNVVSAEIPCKDTDPQLHHLVINNMIHGPCGQINPSSPCMKNGKCTKSFPKQLLHQTEIGNDSYPKYRRKPQQDGGNAITKRVNQQDVEIDNSWVVPYNPWLLRQLQCHTNVEICASIKSIKYVLKYVHKGCDQATFQIQRQNVDEVSNFINARYVGSTEAAWRIFEMPLTERNPPVVHLQVHLENFQRVYFNVDNAQQVATAQPPATTLTSFFKLCENDDFAKDLVYGDVPKYYTWNSSQKMWVRRKRGKEVAPGVFQTPTIGRIYTISPKQGDCYYLRLLLLSVKGPTSFDMLRMLDGTTYPSYRQACIARGLLEDDNMHRSTLQEAAISESPHSLRNLFAILLTQTSPSNPLELWQQFATELSEDFVHQQNVSTENAENMALQQLQNILNEIDGTGLTTYGLPLPDTHVIHRIGQDYTRELNYDQQVQHDISSDHYVKLTTEQRHIFDSIVQKEQDGLGGLIFIDAPGGCGKTFLIETLLAHMRGQGKIAVATASTGLAATMLPGGKTVHSTFKIPLNIANNDASTCSIKKESALSRMLQDASILIIDEATLLHRKVLEAMDTTLQDLRSSTEIMGGLLTILCGDFRQILPVIPKGTRANIVDACLKSSHLWPFVQNFKLITNMRVLLHGDEQILSFAEDLLEVGNGDITVEMAPDQVSLKKFGNECGTVDKLLDSVFPNVSENYTDRDWLMQRAILAPHNDSVSKINEHLMHKLPSDTVTYTSINTIVSEEEAVQYPVEFLNSIETSGLPKHQLQLKKGMPVMLLRSIRPPQLMNGTRCIVIACKTNTVEVQIATGAYKGEHHLLPRIPLQPSDTNFPFVFQRKQFPIRACFAMTINKSQGQTLQSIGLDLRQPIFAHGMLYVALSRTGRKDHIHLLTTTLTRNVVYKEVL